MGSRGRLRWGADGPVGSPVACPRRGPPRRGLAATVLAPADTRRHGLFGNNIGGVGGGGDGPRQERRRGRGRVACRQRRMRPRSPEFHCQAWPPPLSVVAAGAAHLHRALSRGPLGRVPPPVGRLVGRPQTKSGAQATAQHPSPPRVAPVAGWRDNVAAAATVLAPSAEPRGHASKWRALLPPPPPLPPLSPPSLQPPPQPQRHPVAWDCWRRSASPPPRAGNPTSRGTDGVRTVRHAAARGGP